jgi:sugar lactone lactonase YvrE
MTRRVTRTKRLVAGREEGMRDMMRVLLLAWMAFMLTACSDSATPILGCEAGSGMAPDCRFTNPEDLAVAPAGGRLLVSQMGSMDGSRPGNLALYEPGGAIEVLFPGEAPVSADDGAWGSPECPPPDLAAFSPHGIDLVQRTDGRWQLLVVNHGGRESVELFEVDDRDGRLSLLWRGCAVGPELAAFNDVVGRRDGGFYVTHMMPNDSQLTAMLKGALLGSETGLVYSWSADSGFAEVPGSNGAFPNGIELSADERYLFINLYLGSEVRKLDLESGQVVAVAVVERPDNSTWSADGRLLVASHTDGLMATMGCQGLEEGSCGFAFEIVALDPENLTGAAVTGNRGAPMGAATVALEMDGDLYLGTFSGDRITRVTEGAP